ncbi:molybdate ABC transporter substrate-binding protein [Novosphingobium sp. FSW06-99]|uniref:molybdate ABC transporter substrate-binding protein n=1 Tax=Novosphingobium sp. FSW06-99 TaxID=1739113 RepID=UPI00076C487E|nr:molybdate ABC transporter substrate-binding protein [Novosphingobium sp. FSW06-99]KUR75459.1 molybdenum ABC transporter substrate-binding protein [Novosphingobium sp. FSW06-99]
MRLFFFGVFAGLLAGSGTAYAESRGPLVLAAASLQESMNAAADAWAGHHHPRPVLSFAASSALARQIKAGGAADLFVSADEDWMDALAQAGLIVPDTRKSFLFGALVIVGPAGGHLHLRPVPGFPLARALAGGKLAMADPDAVPAGRYGRDALLKMGVWDQVASQVARAENVRAALGLVAHGAAPLGIVYATDAFAEPGVRIVGVFPSGSHAPISYPVARLKAATSPDAEAFRRFLLSAEGKGIFRRYGFVAP